MTQILAPKRVAALGVAMLSAALGSAVYRSFVVSDFVPVRMDVIDSELSPTSHVIAITLPDLSNLHGHTVVLALRLRNLRSEQRQIALLRDGLPRNRVVLPPDRTIGWDIVLSPEMVQALGSGAGNAARSLEVAGDADGWTLTSFEIRNYHVRWNARLMAVVVPGRAGGYTTGAGLLPVVIGLCILALVRVVLPKSPRKPVRLIGDGLAFSAFLLCLICLIAPQTSAYKVLLSRSAFCLVAAGLFSPALLYLLYGAPARAARLPSLLWRSPAILARVWKRHEVTFERGAALLALTAIAIAQPIFEVVSNSPEFFPARGTPPTSALGAVLAVCLGAPLTLLAIERAIRAASLRAAATFYGMVVALLSAAVLMPWFQRGDVLMFPWDALISAFTGIAVALAYGRMQILRQFLTALALAAIVVPALFLLDPGVRQNFLPSESAAAVQTVERTPPIVLVVFDELPANSLLTADGQIDAERYPNFGALAREAHWFRNASTVAYTTSYAVPAILSGRYLTASNAVPTLRYYPVNLFTVLARHYDIFASMRFQQLCPPRACQQNAAIPTDTVGSLVWDFGLVWLHVVLPETLTEELPAVVGDWAEFGATRETPAAATQTGRRGVFAEFVSSIDDRPARLHFIHSMVPHMPFEFVPSGRQYRAPDYQNTRYGKSLLFERASPAYADTVHQRHLAQVGYADRLLGDLVARMREVGVYDDALVIITADHGASYREGGFRRQPRPQQGNLSDILQVPLLVKLPGQQRGEVVERIVETVDIFPTILDVVGANTPLRLDGRSLIDAQEAGRRAFLLRNRNRLDKAPRGLGDLSADRAASLKRKERRFGRGDFTSLYAPPGARHLLGVNVSRSAMRPANDVQITIANPRQFEAVARDRDPLPLYVRGVLSTSRSDPLSVVVAVNGIVTAIAESYRERGGHMFGTLIPETALRDGNNIVTAFVVDGLP